MSHTPETGESIGTISELTLDQDAGESMGTIVELEPNQYISISPSRSIGRFGPRDDATRVPPRSITSLAVAMSTTTLERLREAAQDYGHLNPFFREADEAFADEMIAAYGASASPIPLLVPLGGGLHIPFYAVLLSSGYMSQRCWDSYHRGLLTIMQRVAREMGVSNTLPVMYLRETLYDDRVFDGIGEYMMERVMRSAPVPQREWPQDFSSIFDP